MTSAVFLTQSLNFFSGLYSTLRYESILSIALVYRITLLYPREHISFRAFPVPAVFGNIGNISFILNKNLYRVVLAF